METFDFPYFKYSVEYPESGFRMRLGNSYEYSASPTSPDQRLFRLYFDTMVFYPCTVFKTNAIPIALAVGDLWVDTGSVNQLLWSQDFTNAVWIKDESASVTENYSVAPNGLTQADRVVLPTGTLARVFQTVSNSEVQNLTYSVWLKSNTGANQDVSLFLRQSGFGTVYASSVLTVTPAWQRFSVSGSVPVVNVMALLYHNTSGAPANDLSIWQAQITPTSGPALDIKTTGAPVSTVGNNKPYRWDGSNWTLSTSNIHLNITKQPEINAGRLDAFYNFHKLHKKFIFPHPIYGDIAVKFSKPLVLPKGNTNGSGSIEAFELEFIEIPGGL